MNEVQERLQQLQNKGWTLAALADEMGLTVNALEKWKAGLRQPANPKATMLLFEAIRDKKNIPKKRRYGTTVGQRKGLLRKET